MSSSKPVLQETSSELQYEVTRKTLFYSLDVVMTFQAGDVKVRYYYYVNGIFFIK